MHDLLAIQQDAAIAEALRMNSDYEPATLDTVLACQVPFPVGVLPADAPVFEAGGRRHVCRTVKVKYAFPGIGADSIAGAKHAIISTGFTHVLRAELRRTPVLGYVSKHFYLVVSGVKV